MTAPTDHRTTAPAHRPRPHVADRPTRRFERPDRSRRETAVQVGRLAGEQLAVAGGQLGAGVGNLLFSLVAARLLAPGAFAELTAFLALYLLIHVPAGSLSAGSALAPELAARARRRAFTAGLAVAGALTVLAVPLAALLDLSPVLVLAAAAAAPTAGLLALDRGRLYGLGKRTRVVGSLLAEPAVRLSIGVALAAMAGPVGGAIAVVLAGWTALAIAHLPAHSVPRTAPARSPARTGTAIAAFLLLAVVQNQDVLFANALLAPAEAGRFAVVSTLGGVAAFATTTVPLMLLPRAGRDALRAALLVAGLLGLGAVAIIAVAPGPLVGAVFGGRYESVGAMAVPYVLAMAMLGVARVLIAHACAGRSPTRAVALLVPAALLHAGLLLALGDDAAGVATATLIGTTALTAGAAALALDRPITISRDVAVVAALAVAGLVVRLLATRGIWLDEATSIHQAQMPLGQMLHDLRTTDVHPPLHHFVLWCTIRVFGDGEFAVRIPSLIAATAMIPLLYAAGRDIYDKRAGFAAAALATVAPFAVWYADEARMYALFMVFALLSLWMQVRIVRDKGAGAGSWLGFVLAAAALVYTQYFGALFVGTQLLAFVVAAARGMVPPLRLIAWTALLGLLLAPLLPFAHDQFAANESAGRGFHQPTQTGGGTLDPGARPGAYAVLTNFAWAVVGYHSDKTMTAIAALWPLGVLLALSLLGRGRSWPTLLVVACAILPALGLFVLGQLKPFVFEVRYFIGVVPLALLLIARALTSWARRPAVIAVACAASAVVLGFGLADQQLNGSNPRVYDFKTAVNHIEQRAKPGDVIMFTPFYLDHVIDYYEDRGVEARAIPADGKVPSPKRGQRVFVLASFRDKAVYRDLSNKVVRRLSRRSHLVHSESVPQIRTWEFSR